MEAAAVNAIRRTCLAAVLVIFSLFAAPVHSAGAVLVWPVDPVIESEARATALWLENRGTQPILLQLRIFSWSQVDGSNTAAQNESSAHRLVRSAALVAGAPDAHDRCRMARNTPIASSSMRFRVRVMSMMRLVPACSSLRYSIPLFVYGEGIRTQRSASRGRGAAADAPDLVWRTVVYDGRPHLEVENRGRVHARLTRAELQQGGVAVNMADGLLGYVLAGTKMRWPLPRGVQTPGIFMAVVNGALTSASIPLVP